MDLSILVCSIHTRYATFLPQIQKQLYDQLGALSKEDQDRTEIIVLTDNKTLMLGAKRNLLVNISQGKYVVFVDDDDKIADDYISTLLEATKSNADCIVFQAAVSLNGGSPKTCYYSKDVKQDYNTAIAYYRIPNHICCIKKSVSLKSSFPNVLYGEDAGFGKVLLPHLKTEHKIDKVLYYYNYNSETTETQAWRYNRTNVVDPTRPPIVDVVILSKANDYQTKQMTQKAVDTCFYGSNGLPVNIIVVEGGQADGYQHATTVRKFDKFNYNAFANFGADQGNAEWIMIANNDLVFHDGWLHNLIAAGNDLVSPHEPNDARQKDITKNTKGYVNGTHFSGWCFMIKRKLYEKIGKFDTDVTFWCSDDATIMQCKAVGVKPMLVYDAIVDHVTSATLRREGAETDNLTWRNIYIFTKKYGHHKFEDHPAYKLWLVNHRREIEAGTV